MSSLGRHATIYLVFDALAKVASFGLALGLTYLMVPVDYGLWALLVTITTLMELFFGAAFSSAAGRWYFDRDEADFRRLVFTMGATQGAFVLVTGGLLALFGVPRLVTGIDDIGAPGPLYLVLGAAALSSLTAIPRAVLVTRQESTRAGWLSIVAALVPVLAMGIAAALDGSLESVLWGLFGGHAAVGAVGLVVWLRMSIFSFVASELRGMLGYGLPLVPHIMAHWFLSFVDRYMLQLSLGPVDVANYHVAYLVGFGVLFVGQALSKSWTPDFLSDAAERESKQDAAEQDAITRLIVRKASAVASLVLLLGALAAIWGDEALALLIPATYEDALPDVSLIVLGNLFLALYQIPVAVLFHRKATLHIAGFTTAAAVLNIGLNAWLIPAYNSTRGAALATLISYGVLLLFVLREALRQQDFEVIPLRRWGGYALICCVVALVVWADHAFREAQGLRITVSLGATVVIVALIARGRQLRELWTLLGR